MVQARALLIGAFLISSCSGPPPETFSRPEGEHVLSRITRGKSGELLVAATHSGGAAGDTVYRVLACPTGSSSCEVIASINPYEAEKPMLVADGSRIALVVNSGDRIGQFRNYSRTLPDLRRGGMHLRYRSDAPEARP
jgi:hypothetical protein